MSKNVVLRKFGTDTYPLTQRSRFEFCLATLYVALQSRRCQRAIYKVTGCRDRCRGVSMPINTVESAGLLHARICRFSCNLFSIAYRAYNTIFVWRIPLLKEAKFKFQSENLYIFQRKTFFKWLNQ